MKKNLLLLIAAFCLSIASNAQCTITGTTVYSSTLTCSSFSSCSVITIGNGTASTNLVMNQNWDLTCLGPIQFVIKNNASLDFSTGNYNLDLPAGSSIIIENGGSIGAGGNCSASDLIRIGSIKVASCNGDGGGVQSDFPTLITEGGYNVVTATATPVCGSGTSTITASKNPAPTASTTYNWFTTSSGGTAFLTTTSSSSPYGTSYTTPVLSASTTYYIEATTAGVTSPRKAITVNVTSLPSTPTVTLTQPTCSTATGTITITPPSGSGLTYSINGSTYTNTTGIFSSIAAGTYNVTIKNAAGCISPVLNVTINSQPTAPVQPTLGTVTQPTCSVATGSFTITNYNASYTYTVTPSTGVARSGATITAPAGTYTVTATSNGCTSAASSSVTVNAQPATPVTPTLGAVTQPTCATANGSFTISNYNPAYTYTVTPSTGVNITGATITAPAGTYSVTATLSACTSIASANATVNTQPATPAQPTLGTATQPTCAAVNGSFSITNYNAAYTYAVSPSAGVTITGSTITAPAGTYTVTATSGTCTSVASANIVLNSVVTNTWNGTAWSTGTVPTATDRIVFAGDYSSSSNISGCSCQINSGNIVINSGNTLTITNNVTVSGGSLTFEDSSSLLQISETAVNIGTIIYKRRTTPLKRYDYTYWSSPVANATLSQLATNSLFYAYNPAINNWVRKYGPDSMILGQGYIGREPGNLNYAALPTVQTSFTGTPNNGTITTPITKGTGILNLIGNPYPSAIDIDLFLTDPANAGIVNGTVYLWTHNTAISSSNPGDYVYNYTVNDYAKYNLTGPVKTASAAITGGQTPTGKIAAGQGFFIDANTALSNGTYSATFRNTMRVSGNNTQFFRTTQTENNTTPSSVALEKHRVWISLSNTQGGYNEALVGYIQGATNEMDRLFDGKTLPTENVISIYSMLGNEKLSIQGRVLPFEAADIVPIGYTTSLNGTFSISLENFDGLFVDQNIYLLDRTTGIYHDLKAGAFTFTTTNGTFNDRFELRFNRETLGTNSPIDNNGGIRVITKAQHLAVLSGNAIIKSIEVRDLLGKLLYTKKDIHTNEFNTDAISASSQMLIVKATLDNDQVFTKKVLMQ